MGMGGGGGGGGGGWRGKSCRRPGHKSLEPYLLHLPSTYKSGCCFLRRPLGSGRRSIRGVGHCRRPNRITFRNTCSRLSFTTHLSASVHTRSSVLFFGGCFFRRRFFSKQDLKSSGKTSVFVLFFLSPFVSSRVEKFHCRR